MKSKINRSVKILLLIISITGYATLLPGYAQQHHSYSSNTDKGSHTIKIDDDNGSLEIKYTGDVTFNDDESLIKAISENGSVTFKKNGNTITANTDAGGQIFYEVNGGARKSTLNTKESALLASAIKTMIAYGVGAKDRVERIYKKSGSKGVLSETGKMKTDYVKGIYLNYLLETNSLSVDEMTSIAKSVKDIITSDYEKGKLLGKFSEKYLTSPVTAKAYLAAVQSIDSDYEKAKAVKIILKQPLPDAQFSDVLTITNSINSDYEKSGVLKQVLANNKISGAQFSDVLNATAAISSDYEKANVLKTILKNNQLPEARFNDALAAAVSISSDYEKANVLKQLAAVDLGSEAQWITLINSAEKISSDYEKANVLINIATRMQTGENVKAAYAKAAKTISSNHEYGRTLRAVK